MSAESPKRGVAGGSGDAEKAPRRSDSEQTFDSNDAGAMASSFLKSMGQTLQQRAPDSHRHREHSEHRERRRGRSSRSPRRRSRSRRRHDDYRRRNTRDDSRSYRRRSRSRGRSNSHTRNRSREAPRRSSRRDDPPVVPLHLRPKKLNMWDLAPPGFENISSMDAKASGMFPPPGQSAGSRNVASFNPSVLFEHTHREENERFRPSSRGEREFPSTASRQARRLYVGNIPHGIDEDGIAVFFNDLFVRMHIASAGEMPVQNIQINHDKNYAFVEFRDADQATMGMGLDGVAFQMQKLKIRRPKDYIPPVGQPEPRPPSLTLPGVVSNTVPDSPNKVYVGGLPTYLQEAQIMELLGAFGELKAFNLVKDTATRMSRGFAFCEYADPNVTDAACQGLNGMELGDKRMVVQRASVGARAANGHGPPSATYQQPPPPSSSYAAPEPAVQQYLPPMDRQEAVRPTPIVQLLNMVTMAELTDNDEYNDILDDVRDECQTYGSIVELLIPRQDSAQPDTKVPGVGKIFIRYANEAEATQALNALAGRQFMGRTVIASYISEADFESQNY
ncbi:hypothetical protein GGI15_004689 [Coemansia interrupta]|uniref:Splicing factor U2AF subunit n=1 Tax=Coemansia interrupta TaxID=1126814 RepID=A0A9W8H7T5_9FUNG|nr:hypothetical protein GGI15_004689 [Coemansia interrupta]